MKCSNVTLHVHYDLCPKWLELAFRHLADAKERKLARVAAWRADDQEARGQTLETEFEASMQAIMAAAISIDSFYGSLRDKTNIPRETIEAWRKNGTARYKQVSEVVRRAFAIAQKHVSQISTVLETIYRFRDQAIHPTGDASVPVMHPELLTGVEWRLVAFSTTNAEEIVRGAYSIIHELVTKGKPSSPEVQRYADGLSNLIAPLANK